MLKHYILLVVGSMLLASQIIMACDESGEKLLQSNMRKWEQAGWDRYSFVQKRQCFCAPEYRKATRIFVDGGKVVNAEFVEGGAATVPAKVMADLTTIEDWFAVIRDAKERKADLLEVVFHPELGYPQKIEIDMRTRRADDEQSVVISEVMQE